MCVAIIELYGDEKLEEILEDPFLVSSAFPYVGKKEKDHFLPKPIENLEFHEDFREYFDESKKLRKVKYVHEDIFNKIITGELKDINLIENLQNKTYIIKTPFLFERLKETIKIRRQEKPRNVINRVTQESQGIFYSSGIYYGNVGLFFLIRCTEDQWTTVNSSLKYLQDKGFGPDISIGAGAFRIEEISDETPIVEPLESSRFLTLSRYIPTSEELKRFNNGGNYELISKRGLNSDGRVKKHVRFFAEGSVFPTMENGPYGRIVAVLKDSIEYGYAYHIGMK
jgi:CRISPR-associated protein Csm4